MQPAATNPADLEPLLDDLASPFLSLEEIAQRRSMSLASISALLVTSDVVEKLAQREVAAAARARQAALAFLPQCVDALASIVADYSARVRYGRPSRPTAAPAPSELNLAVNARRAAHMLLRISALQIRPIRPAPRLLPESPAASPGGTALQSGAPSSASPGGTVLQSGAPSSASPGGTALQSGAPSSVSPGGTALQSAV